MDDGAVVGPGDQVPDPEMKAPADLAPATEATADSGTVGPSIAPAEAEPSVPRPEPPALGAEARSPDPSVCPFLRRDFGGTLVAPASVPGVEQTCVAIGAPRLQSLRQQELVCLRAAHADCPRYLHGAMAAAPGRSRLLPQVPAATVAALLILVLSAALSFGFVVQRGGIGMPVVGAPSPAVAVVSTPAPVSTGASAEPAGEATASPTEAPPSATPSPTPAPTPTPTPTPTPKPTRKPAATPKSDRYAVLRSCPDRKKCFIYTVRSGDNLFSIAAWFGHPMATIYAWNPAYANGARLRAGAEIRMPPPTR